MNLKFWEKDDPLKDLSSDFSPGDDSLDLDMPAAPGPQPSMTGQQMPQFPTPDQHPSNMAFAPTEPSGGDGGQKDSLLQELILARLDLIKNQLDVLNQRVANLEKQPEAQPAAPQQQRGPWYTKQ